MHLTFLEHYPHPSTWYGKRLAYTRSAAVSSIVGYVMGIGDRHPQNIMFDSRTAELLHIDFGIAFEQVRKWQLMGTALRCVTVAYPITCLCCVCFAVTGSLAEVSRADPLPSHPRPCERHGRCWGGGSLQAMW